MTDRWVAADELEIEAVAAAFARIIRLRCPEHAVLARALFERIRPARWTLEWSLPAWLGEALALHPRVISQVVLSNVMGLGSIRLQDDLADGEVPAEEIVGAQVLSAVLFDAALQPYRAMFDGQSPFWGELDRRLGEWRSATLTDSPTPGRGDPQPGAGQLAARAAPLHIPAYAMCLAADRADLYPLLGGALDRVLAALVLLDHAADWETDLAAGRWNAFVDALAGEADPSAAGERRRTAVRVALMTSDRARDFFDRVATLLSSAIALAEPLPVPVPRLVEHLRSMAAEVEAQGSSYGDHFRALGDRTARLWFPEATHAR